MIGATHDWDALEGVIAGEVVLPHSPDYDTRRKPAIARFDDIRPQAVVCCGTPADVSESIAFAVRSGLPVAIRSGGHCFAGRSSTRGMVLDVTPMSSVSVSDGVATVGSGARLGDVYDALTEHRLTIPAGCGSTVGIAGLTLGGGLGILGRTYGPTSDHLIAAETVLADGRIVQCDDHQNEDLFWALRGAGAGSFGVVTSLTFGTVPAPAATTFSLVWPLRDAIAVIGAWQTWAPAAPDELAASLLVTAAGGVDRPPVVTVFGAMLGAESDTAELLEDLVTQVGADPTSASHAYASFRATKHHLAQLGDRIHEATQGGPPEAGHPYSKSEFFRRPLPTDAIVELVDNVGKGLAPGQFRELDFTPWGGAYNRVPADATAFVHRDEHFLLKHAVTVDPDASAAERQDAQQWLTRSWATVHPWGSGHAYQNFPDPDLADSADAYYGSNRSRLQRVKARYDPDGFFAPATP